MLRTAVRRRAALRPEAQEPRTTTTLPVPAAPDAVVLIHGLWMTPRCWEHRVGRNAQRGDRVLAPAYPGLEVEGEALVAAGPVVFL